jgi:ABC-type antimicrobial peptide transport system, ATPase component
MCSNGMEDIMSDVLKVNNLCKTYIVNKRQNNVLRNVNFEIEKGEMVGIMGPSGSGKTTLLYTVSGMDTITAGNIDFFGKELSKLSDNDISDARLNEMGFVFQQMYMLKNLTIYDNIILPAYQSNTGKYSRKEINDYAVELMHKLGISDVADNDINEVSGGQLQRACICRSLINRPRIIFADEPTGALNQQSSSEVMNIFNQINEAGTSIMLVTHDQKVAAACERILYIEDGNIREEIRLGKMSQSGDKKEREKKLRTWLMDLGW